MDPYESSDFIPPEVTEARPATTIPRTLGILNIVFGVLLLFCALWSGASMAMQSAMIPAMARQQQQMQKTIEAERKAELDKLRDLEKASKNAQEKAELQRQQKILLSQPTPQLPDFSKLSTNPRTRVFALVDATTGLLLNILMIISGIGLLAWKEWARLTALGVAAVKLLRLVGLYTFFAVAVVPTISQQFRELFEEVAKTAPPDPNAPGPEQFAAMATAISVAMVGYAIFMILFGSIYPIVVLALLTRRRVKAACTSARGL
jgi:hypothetical protein